MDGKHVMKTPTRLKWLKYGSMAGFCGHLDTPQASVTTGNFLGTEITTACLQTNQRVLYFSIDNAHLMYNMHSTFSTFLLMYR